MDADLIRGPRAPEEEAAEDEPYVEFESRISIRDVADLLFTRATRSTGAQGIAGFLMAMGFMGALGRAHPDLWVPAIILSLAIGTGFILLPFIWWRFLSAPETMVQRIEADTSGMIIHVADRAIKHPWSVYRTAQETNRLFILTSRVVEPQMFTKREMTESEAAAFRRVLSGVDLLRRMDEGPRWKPWLGFVVGAAIAIATLLVMGAIRL